MSVERRDMRYEMWAEREEV